MSYEVLIVVFLSCIFKLPESFRVNEVHYRTMLQKRLTRGKVECHIRFNSVVQKTGDVVIDETQAKSIACCVSAN